MAKILKPGRKHLFEKKRVKLSITLPREVLDYALQKSPHRISKTVEIALANLFTTPEQLK